MKKFIFTNNKKIFNRVLAGALAFIVLVAIVAGLFIIDSFAIANPKCYHKFVLSTFNGSYDAENMPTTYWQIESLEDDNGNPLKMKAKVELPITNKAERFLGQIWINVSDLEGDKLEVFTYYHTSNTTTVSKPLNKDDKPFVLTANELKKSKDGWFKVYDFADDTKYNKAYAYIDDYSIIISTGVRIREMVFIDTENELVKDITTIDEYVEEQKYANPNGFVVKYAVDESKYFDMSKVDSE